VSVGLTWENAVVVRSSMVLSSAPGRCRRLD